jgi:hypothetical protein
MILLGANCSVKIPVWGFGKDTGFKQEGTESAGNVLGSGYFFKLTKKGGGDKWCILTFRTPSPSGKFSEKVLRSAGSRIRFQKPKTILDQAF